MDDETHWQEFYAKVREIIPGDHTNEAALAAVRQRLSQPEPPRNAVGMKDWFATYKAIGIDSDMLRDEYLWPKIYELLDACVGAYVFALDRDKLIRRQEQLAIIDQIQQGTYGELMTDDCPDVEWVIPGFLGRGEVFFLTGGEGTGKTTFGYHVAATVDQGVHPFTLEKINRANVIQFELEVPKAHLKRFLNDAPIAKTPRVHWDLESFGQPQEIIPDEDEDLSAFSNYVLAAVDLHGSDLVIIGPHDALSQQPWATSKQAEFGVAFKLLMAKLRDRGCAVIVTGISSHNGSKPMGSKMLSHSADFGYELRMTDKGRRTLAPWRNDRDDTREIPTEFALRNGWLFAAPADRWNLVRQAIIEADTTPSLRDLADTTGISKSTVGRLIEAHQDEYDQLIAA